MNNEHIRMTSKDRKKMIDAKIKTSSMSPLKASKTGTKEENYNTVWYKNTDTLIKGKWIPTMPPSIQDYKKPVLKFLNEDD